MKTSDFDIENDPLWLSIESFRIGGEASDFGENNISEGLSFSQRLARENGWSLADARVRIDEYRRFLYLAARAGHPVTPSDCVDQVWHQHLVYTENYWVDLCGEVLPAPLHHGPTRGGAKERTHFQDQYERTLHSYERFFGPPPPDVWPATEERFAQSIASVRVDRRNAWIIPKPKLSFAIPAHSRFAFGGAAMLPIAGVFPFNLDGPTFLAVYGLILVLSLAFCCVWYYSSNGILASFNASGDGEPALDWVSLALLAGGKRRVLQTALLELTRRKIVRCDGAKFELVDDAIYQPLPQDSESAIATYQAIVGLLKKSGKAQTIKKLQLAINSITTRRELQLQATGYVSESDPKMLYRGIVMTVALVTLSIGLLRCYQGVTNEHPIGFLIAEMVVGAVLFAIVFRLDGKLTSKGQFALERSRLNYKTSGLKSLQPEQIAAGHMLPFLAILGPTAVTAMSVNSVDVMVHEVLFGEELRELQRSQTASKWGGLDFGDGSSSDWSSSFSSGGGDAGCGGGCGGCGGCGG